MTYAAVAAVAVAVQWAVILGTRSLRHEHQWTEWSKWLLESGGEWNTYAWWASRRRCRDCNKEQRRKTGKHQCKKPKACGHAKQFDTLLETDAERIARLERELSINSPAATEVLRQRLAIADQLPKKGKKK